MFRYITFSYHTASTCSNRVLISEKLKTMWESLEFNVKVHLNQTKAEMENILKMAAAQDHGEYDCLVVCLLSHGKRRELYGKDGHTLCIDDIKSYFFADNCKTLAGKPKLFFIQACQGTFERKGNMLNCLYKINIIHLKQKLGCSIFHHFPCL